MTQNASEPTTAAAAASPPRPESNDQWRLSEQIALLESRLEEASQRDSVARTECDLMREELAECREKLVIIIIIPIIINSSSRTININILSVVQVPGRSE